MSNKETLRLFNGVNVSKVQKAIYCTEDTLEHGFIVVGLIPDRPLLRDIKAVHGLSGKQANSSFHKSWSVIKNSSMESLVAQQVVHYITTYGFEGLGIYNDDFIYIPNEELQVPGLQDNLKIRIIKAYADDELKEKVTAMASSGIALSDESIRDLLVIILENSWREIYYVTKNRELKAALQNAFKIVPTEPVEWLRYAVNELTGETLLIKNHSLINKLKESDSRDVDRLINSAPKNLASIFYRYKPLFLAMKKASSNKTFFNQLRKQAPYLHKPMRQDYLSNLTATIKSGESVDYNRLQKELERVNVYRKIRLANALAYRLSGATDILYHVRNGKGYATDFEWDYNKFNLLTSRSQTIVLKSIAKEVGEKLEGKNVFIPLNTSYALPTSEKNFVGNYPKGTSVEVARDMVFGIYWENLQNCRVDLDLSILSDSGKIGWDVSYRNSNCTVLFSGDVTSAPEGASELFYIQSGTLENYIVMVNYFNFQQEQPLTAKLFVASEEVNPRENYMVNPNNILMQANIEIAQRQNAVGIVNGNYFYFYNMEIGTSITASGEEVNRARHAAIMQCKSMVTLNTILAYSNVQRVLEKDDADIDLSPENVCKETFVSLLSG